jgi:glycosyltransferase involved in cell wall biosynthesis
MKLSILIPTRNRTKFLNSIVKFILKSNRDNFELIVCDASDTHFLCQNVLNEFLSDKRVKLIDNSTAFDGKIKSMNDNWATALENATGEWIVIIGDDDLCDPDLIDFLVDIEKALPNICAIKWNPIHVDLCLPKSRGAKIPMGNKILLADCNQSLLSQSSWPSNKKPPHSLCSPYHGAVKKITLDNIFKKNKFTRFKFNTPDYDLGWNVCLSNESFILCERPFSISGVSHESNSYSVRNSNIRKINQKRWNSESKVLDCWGLTDNSFYFSFPMAVLGFINIFCYSNNINNIIISANFIDTLKNTLNNHEDEESFETYKEELLVFLKIHFNNNFNVNEMKFKIKNSHQISGLYKDTLYIDNKFYDNDLDSFYKFVFGLLRPANKLVA